MSDQKLRSSLIRLAHANPELRAEILPLLEGLVRRADASKAPIDTWAGVAARERERLAMKVVKLKGAYVNLREVVDVMSDAPAKSGEDLLFAVDLLEKVELEISSYLTALKALLNIRGPRPRF